jgi:hypothetical protein
VAIVVLAPTVVLFFPALGLKTAAVGAFVATLLVVALVPAVEFLLPDDRYRAGRLSTAALPLAALVATACCAGVGLVVDRTDADHPTPSQLVYALDKDSGKAWWASTELHPGAYTSRYVHGRKPLPVDYPYLAGTDLATGPARAANLPAPEVTVASDEVLGRVRTITLTVRPQRAGVRLVALDLRTRHGRVAGATMAGRSVPRTALGHDRIQITFHAPGPDGVQATFTVTGRGPVTLRAIDGSDGLAGLPGFVPRPDGVAAAGTHSSDLVLVSATTRLG